MNATFWQIIAVVIALAILAFALRFVITSIDEKSVQFCSDSCDFEGWRCKDSITSESCLDQNYDTCKEYRAIRCLNGCDSVSGTCLS